jgi:hypothetical protein
MPKNPAPAPAPAQRDPKDRLIGPAELRRKTDNADIPTLIAKGIIPEALILGPATRRWWESEIDAALAALQRGKGRAKNPKRPSKTPYTGPEVAKPTAE